MAILSIGIPTFNRASRLQKQLAFLYEELKGFTIEEKKEISLYVSDNCSTDNTKEVVMSSSLMTSSGLSCHYHCNVQNVGLAGNLQVLYSKLDGDYLWIIGDDDTLKSGILRRVFEECKTQAYSYIFVNHKITKKDKVVKESVLEGIDIDNSDKSILWELYKQSGTVMMLISACIYRTDYVKEYLKKYDVDLVIPCSLSFYCAAQGKTKYIEEPYIDNDQTENSWKKLIVKVFYELLPSLLLRLPRWGYSRKECIKEFFVLKRQYLRPKIKEVLHINQ